MALMDACALGESLAWGAPMVQTDGYHRAGTGSLGAVDPGVPYRPMYTFRSSGPASVFGGSAEGTPLPVPLPREVEAPRVHVPLSASALLDLLSVNKSQLADILGITRPTLYEWLAGKEPSAEKGARIDTIARLLAEAGVRSGQPLNAAFVRRALPGEVVSLLDVLCAESIDETKAVMLLRAAVAQDARQTTERAEREERLRSRGFDPVDDDAARETLAANVAALSWQKP